jgi:hypothetical protein
MTLGQARMYVSRGTDLFHVKREAPDPRYLVSRGTYVTYVTSTIGFYRTTLCQAPIVPFAWKAHIRELTNMNRSRDSEGGARHAPNGPGRRFT